MLPELLSHIPSNQEIVSVIADGAYDTRKCHDAIAKRGTAAVIPPGKNATPWKDEALERLPATRRYGCQNIWAARCGDDEVDTTA